MRPWYALIILLSCTTAHAFEFKGIEVGGPATYQPQQLLDALTGGKPGNTCGLGANEIQVCNGIASVAGAVARLNANIHANGLVSRVSLEIRSSDFEDVATVAVQKYGKPTKTSTEVLQNRMGAKFQNTVHHWQGKGGRYIRLTKYSGGSLEYGLMYFGSAEDTAMLKEASAPKSDDM